MRRADFLKGAATLLLLGAAGGSRVHAAQKKSTIMLAKCVGCGDCVRACPVQAITLTQGKARVDHDICVGCRLCIMTCSYGAPQ